MTKSSKDKNEIEGRRSMHNRSHFSGTANLNDLKFRMNECRRNTAQTFNSLPFLMTSQGLKLCLKFRLS